ncbi:Hypothetical_protein [Hexamita inflata]|uniref:Hypothetical_protein n=1 Tax=Hexamita inflata TaxID=28002 RepID=A0AA86R7G5_9EUKA|nr:Hypothetical protein HINF_LOCUS55313 [Hexamita inflata]
MAATNQRVEFALHMSFSFGEVVGNTFECLFPHTEMALRRLEWHRVIEYLRVADSTRPPLQNHNNHGPLTELRSPRFSGLNSRLRDTIYIWRGCRKCVRMSFPSKRIRRITSIPKSQTKSKCTIG